jgi:hypothetical protein
MNENRSIWVQQSLSAFSSEPKIKSDTELSFRCAFFNEIALKQRMDCPLLYLHFEEQH